MKIPVAKPYLTADEAQSAYDTILTNWVTQGPRVQEFEEKFAAYTGAKHAVAVSNCTTALHLAMIVAGVKAGDEVICPSMSYIATANAIMYVGAKPVFAEVRDDFNIDPIHTASLITNKTKAILIVHQIGMPADIESFQALCKQHNLVLIEDAACAAGSAYKGKKIGSHSDLVCFSFHPRKVITTGDGGMITTNNEAYNQRLRLLRQHGMSVNDRVRHASTTVIIEDHLEVGYNYRLTDIQAAVGIKQLEKLDFLVTERRKIAQRYNEAFKSIDCFQLPAEGKDCFTNYQSYAVILKESSKIGRNELMQTLLDLGISTRRGVMTSHRETAYKNSDVNKNLPKSEHYSDSSIVLPLYVPMSNEEVEYVIQAVRDLMHE
jgi:dTDP-4-amino-4,6-dideoxygalactose transaminase